MCLGLSVNAFLKRNFTANISHYYDFIPIVGFAFLRTYQKEMNGFHMGFDRAFEDFLSLSLILGNTISALESPLTKPLPKQGQTPESSYFLFSSLLGILDRVLKASLAVANEFRGTQKSLVELDKMISDSKQTNKMQKFVEELIEPSEESFYLGRENEIEEVLDMIFRVYPCSNEFKLAM